MLEDDNLCGQLPDIVSYLTSLKALRFSVNQLVGLIPQGLMNLNLSMLDLNDNMLMDPIPMFRDVKAKYSLFLKFFVS